MIGCRYVRRDVEDADQGIKIDVAVGIVGSKNKKAGPQAGFAR